MAKSGPRKGRQRHNVQGAGIKENKNRLFIVNTLADDLGRLQHTANPNPKREGPYTNSDRILLVGEGNFSFALALATSIGGTNITATSYDTEKEVYIKYESAPNIIRGLRSLAVTVGHGVDATRLDAAESLAGQRFDKIVFNFPHVGGATEEDVEANTAVLRGFFAQAQKFLSPRGGEVHVALRQTPFYERWNIVEVAKEAGLALHSDEPFEGQRFKALGYAPQRTNPAVREAPSLENARLYIFRPESGARVQAAAAKGDVAAQDSVQKQSWGSALKKPAGTGNAADGPVGTAQGKPNTGETPTATEETSGNGEKEDASSAQKRKPGKGKDAGKSGAKSSDAQPRKTEKGGNQTKQPITSNTSSDASKPPGWGTALKRPASDSSHAPAGPVGKKNKSAKQTTGEHMPVGVRGGDAVVKAGKRPESLDGGMVQKCATKKPKVSGKGGQQATTLGPKKKGGSHKQKPA